MKAALKHIFGAMGILGPASWVARRLRPLGTGLFGDGSRHDLSAFTRYMEGTTAPKRLHMGCGGNYLSGWLNTDYYRDERRIHLDVTKRFPYPSDTFDFAFSEHMIEHIDYAGARNMTSECLRVLKPGGVLRLATPDLGFLLRIYHEPSSDLHRRYIEWNARTYIGLKAPHDALSVMNNYMRDWGHRYIYDEAGLARLLHDAGFIDVTPCRLHESTHLDLTGLENSRRMPDGFLALESLILEATKPEQ